MTLGTKIRRARLAKKMSLEKLGKLMHVSRQLVHQWENGKSDPRTHIEALSKHLEMPLEYFYDHQRPQGALTAKIGLLSPENQDMIEAMIDKFLQQQQAQNSRSAKKA